MRAKGSRPPYSWLAFATAIGFIAGMLVMAALVTMFPTGAASTATPTVEAANRPSDVANRPAETVNRAVEVKPTKQEEPSPVSEPAAPAVAVPSMAANPLEDLRHRNLTLPVQG